MSPASGTAKRDVLPMERGAKDMACSAGSSAATLAKASVEGAAPGSVRQAAAEASATRAHTRAAHARTDCTDSSTRDAERASCE